MPCKGLSRSIGGDFNHDPFVTLFWGTRWSCSIVLVASCCVPSADGIIWGHVFAPLTSHYWANVPATVGPLKQAGWKNWKTATCPVKKGINWLYIYIYIYIFFFFFWFKFNASSVTSIQTPFFWTRPLLPVVSVLFSGWFCSYQPLWFLNEFDYFLFFVRVLTTPCDFSHTFECKQCLHGCNACEDHLLIYLSINIRGARRDVLTDTPHECVCVCVCVCCVCVLRLCFKQGQQLAEVQHLFSH